jgi:hypothetical protein
MRTPTRSKLPLVVRALGALGFAAVLAVVGFGIVADGETNGHEAMLDVIGSALRSATPGSLLFRGLDDVIAKRRQPHSVDDFLVR